MAEVEKATKARINRVRRIAARQGLRLVKNGERCSWATGYGGYIVYPAAGGPAVFGTTGEPYKDLKIWTATLEDVETWLAERVLPAPAPSKVAENRVRRAAARHGLKLQRLRRRDRRAEDYAMYQLVDGLGVALLPAPEPLDGIERALKKKTRSA